ncbi:hypothetical protein Pmani_002030 [Petrolisthes manimaculis]|uniref:Uncharacterized protein n=1 Tax=Petrolisthes manimaculis TaxID=1843537 RepID=A0AAE1QIC6_9EUCA|nr:hypothetical protein Pmani_002030 [Petrolisthes manimaculis]
MLQLRPKKRPRFTAVRGVVKQSKRKKEWPPKTEMMDEYKPKGPKAVSGEVFFSTYWEQRPLYIQRKDRKDLDRKYFNGLFSTEDFDNILRKQRVLYTKNLDMTSYSNGQRETHNPTFHRPVSKNTSTVSVVLMCPVSSHGRGCRVWQGSAAMAEDVEFGRVYFILPDTVVEELTMRLLKSVPLDATVDQRDSNLMLCLLSSLQLTYF